jgi:hypothetical protein
MVDSEGRNLHAIIADQFENFVPRWSRDGPSIYFTSNRSGKWQIWKLELASGQKTQVTDRGGISAFESYHGSTLYYAKREFGGLFRRAVSGGPEVRVINALRVGDWGAFAVTGKRNILPRFRSSPSSDDLLLRYSGGPVEFRVAFGTDARTTRFRRSQRLAMVAGSYLPSSSF